jgi:hypothetical protein
VNTNTSEPLTITADTVVAYLEERGRHGSADFVRQLARSSTDAWQREQQWRAVERQLRERLARYETPRQTYVDPGPVWTGD